MTKRDKPDSRATIADVSARLNVTHRTLRFYEQRGLVSPHRVGRHRKYTEEDVERLAQIIRLKALGFSLTEITDVLRQSKDGAVDLGEARCRAQIEHLRQQLQTITTALAELERLQSSYQA